MTPDDGTSTRPAPGTPAPSPTETAAAVAQLADSMGRASTVLFNYRNDNPAAPDLDRVLNIEMALDRQAIALRTQAIRLLGDESAQALAGLRQATQQVDAFLVKVQKIEATLSLSNAVLSLAGAAVVGDSGGVLSALGGVASALKGLTAPPAAA